MTPTATALLGFAAWTIVLLVTIAVFRSMQVQTTGRSANSFSPAGDDCGDFGKRLTRAHANCYENLPIAGAIMLYAIATNQTAATDGLAYLYLTARIAQSTVHLISTSNAFVMMRFALFIVQNLILIFWLIKLFGLI